MYTRGGRGGVRSELNFLQVLLYLFQDNRYHPPLTSDNVISFLRTNINQLDVVCSYRFCVFDIFDNFIFFHLWFHRMHGISMVQFDRKHIIWGDITFSQQHLLHVKDPRFHSHLHSRPRRYPRPLLVLRHKTRQVQSLREYQSREFRPNTIQKPSRDVKRNVKSKARNILGRRWCDNMMWRWSASVHISPLRYHQMSQPERKSEIPCARPDSRAH